MTEALLSTARFRPGGPIRPRPALTPPSCPGVGSPARRKLGFDLCPPPPSPSGTPPPHLPPTRLRQCQGCAATGLWKKRAQLRLETCLLPRSGSAGLSPPEAETGSIPGQARILPFVPAQPLRSPGTLPGECLL